MDLGSDLHKKDTLLEGKKEEDFIDLVTNGGLLITYNALRCQLLYIYKLSTYLCEQLFLHHCNRLQKSFCADDYNQ